MSSDFVVHHPHGRPLFHFLYVAVKWVSHVSRNSQGSTKNRWMFHQNRCRPSWRLALALRPAKCHFQAEPVPPSSGTEVEVSSLRLRKGEVKIERVMNSPHLEKMKRKKKSGNMMKIRKRVGFFIFFKVCGGGGDFKGWRNGKEV